MARKPESSPVPHAQPNPIFRAPLACHQKHLKLNKHFNRPCSKLGFLQGNLRSHDNMTAALIGKSWPRPPRSRETRGADGKGLKKRGEGRTEVEKQVLTISVSGQRKCARSAAGPNSHPYRHTHVHTQTRRRVLSCGRSPGGVGISRQDLPLPDLR